MLGLIKMKLAHQKHHVLYSTIPHKLLCNVCICRMKHSTSDSSMPDKFQVLGPMTLVFPTTTLLVKKGSRAKNKQHYHSNYMKILAFVWF